MSSIPPTTIDPPPDPPSTDENQVSDRLPPSPPPPPPAPPLFGTRPPDLPPIAEPPTPQGPPPPRWQLPLAIVVAVALLIGSFAAGWALRDRDGDDGAARATGDDTTSVTFDDDGADDRPSEPPIESSGDEEEPVAAVADAVAPTVVQLETAQGLGSGVIYDPDGLILTAAHVVEGSPSVTVRLADGRSLQGTVVGSHTDSDIGVVAIEDPPEGLPVATLAGSAPDVGDLAVAVGSPYGLDQTVTSGIVSALDRPAPPGGPGVGTIQIDTPINPGNSGGPVANRDGEIIGIASYIQSTTGGNVGLGFAVPIDIAARVADALVAGEDVEFGYLGIEGGDAAGAGGSVPGALIADVRPGSPAEEAGLEDGDLVIKVDGTPVNSFGDLGVIIRRHAPGDELQLTVSRNGDEQEITVTLGSTADAGD